MLFGLCRSVWVIYCLSIFLVPSQNSNTPFYPQNATNHGTCPRSLLFRCFHLKLRFESIKELGSASLQLHNIEDVPIPFLSTATSKGPIFPLAFPHGIPSITYQTCSTISSKWISSSQPTSSFNKTTSFSQLTTSSKPINFSRLVSTEGYTHSRNKGWWKFIYSW